jgi:hypothetical protein
MDPPAPVDAGPEASTVVDASDAGNESDGYVSPEASVDAAAPTAGVFLFDGNADGTVYGGRSGADALCATAAARLADGSFAVSHVHAFLSVSDTDEIRDMPANYGVPTTRPVGSITGAVVATSWSGLLSGTLLQSLDSAGIRTAGSGWYSGSNPDGSVATLVTDGGVHPYTCSGWTSSDAFLDGEYGYGSATDSTWMGVGQATCPLGNYSLLCIGWN